MNQFSLEDVKYLNVEILRKIRYKMQKKIYSLRGQERIEAETDHAYLSDYITRLEKSEKYHKNVYLKNNQPNRR